MLTDRELAQIRAEQEKVLPEVVTIERASRTSDGFGGHGNASWVAVASDVPARITQAQTLDLGGQGGRKIEVEKWTVRVPYGTDMREHDHVLWGDVTIRIDELKAGTYRTVLTGAGEVVK